jgi:transposase
MGYNFAGGGDGDRVLLMPPDPRDWLPPEHLAWAVRRAAAELDLAPLLAAYRAGGQGSTAYHPRMMVALIVYCYRKGIRSSRAVEMATFDDVGARVICGGLHPGHAADARFTGRHKEPLKGLLVQSSVACAREGLVRVGVTAGEGTKGQGERAGGRGRGRGAAGAGHRGTGAAAGGRGGGVDRAGRRRRCGRGRPVQRRRRPG